jgi:hypothetical protein
MWERGEKGMKTIEQVISNLQESKEFLVEIKPNMRGNDLALVEGAEMYVDSLLEWVLEEEKRKEMNND